MGFEGDDVNKYTVGSFHSMTSKSNAPATKIRTRNHVAAAEQDRQNMLQDLHIKNGTGVAPVMCSEVHDW